MAKSLIEGLLSIIPLLLIFPVITQLLDQWAKQIAPKDIYSNGISGVSATNRLTLKLTNLPSYRCLVTVRAQINNNTTASQTVQIFIGINADQNHDFNGETSAFNSAFAIRNATIPAGKWESVAETFLPNDTPAKLWEGQYLICQIVGTALLISNLEIIMIPV